MQYLLLLIIILGCTHYTLAQNTFSRLIITPEYWSHPRDIISLENGGLVICDNFTDYFTNQINGIHIYKLDQNGNRVAQWIQYLPQGATTFGRFAELIKCKDGGFALCTRKNDTVYETITLIYRFNQNLEVLWKKEFTRNDARIVCKTLIECADGGFISTGLLNFTSDNYEDGDFYLFKIDKNGELEWEKQYGNSKDYESARYLVRDRDKGYILGGWYTPINDKEKTYGMIVKTDQNGELVWEKKITFQWNLYEDIKIKPYPAGGYIAWGRADEDNTFSSDTYYNITRLSEIGDTIWRRPLFHHNGYLLHHVFDIDFFKNGDILAAGRTKGLNINAWLARYSPEGAPKWQKAYALVDPDDKETSYHEFYDVDVLEDETILVAGNVRYVPYLDAVSGSRQIWMLHLDNLGCLEADCTQYGATDNIAVTKCEELDCPQDTILIPIDNYVITHIDTAPNHPQIDQINLYPNPTQNLMHIQFSQEATTLQIYTINGQLVHQQQLPKGEKRTTINVEHLEAGLYYCVGLGEDGVVLGREKMVVLE